MTHHLTVAPWNYIYVSDGRKHFIVIPDTTPTLDYGDSLVLTLRGHPAEPPITRWVSYLESGVGLAPDHVAVELVSQPPPPRLKEEDLPAIEEQA